MFSAPSQEGAVRLSRTLSIFLKIRKSGTYFGSLSPSSCNFFNFFEFFYCVDPRYPI